MCVGVLCVRVYVCACMCVCVWLLALSGCSASTCAYHIPIVKCTIMYGDLRATRASLVGQVQYRSDEVHSRFQTTSQ